MQRRDEPTRPAQAAMTKGKQRCIEHCAFDTAPRAAQREVGGATAAQTHAAWSRADKLLGQGRGAARARSAQSLQLGESQDSVKKRSRRFWGAWRPSIV